MSSGTYFKMQLDRGFTVVEMMITLLVLAILIVVGAPAFTDLIKDNRMLSDVYAMRAALNNARSEAMARRNFVTVCRSDDGATCTGDWNEGYIAFTDADGDGIADDPNDPADGDIFGAKVLDAETLDIVYSNAANRVRFDSQGHATGFNGTFTVCDDRGAAKARGLIVTPGGIVRAAVEDPNDPGVAIDHEGNELACP